MSEFDADVPDVSLPTPDRKEIYDGHPEVHHYTTLEGAVGIWTNQTLRATRYDCLNDPTEVSLFQDYLRTTLPTAFTKYCDKHLSSKATFAELVKKNGSIEKLAQSGTEWFVKALFETTYGAVDVPSTNAFALPFIISFCSHCSPNQDYEQHNGLLSQWRAYGRSTPCAIVFDTKALLPALQQEPAISGSFRQVIYSNDTASAEKMFAPLIRSIIRSWTAENESALKFNLGECFAPFVNDSACFKHHSFSEENEVRIIAVPKTSRGISRGDPEDFSAHPLVRESCTPVFDSNSQRVRFRMHLSGPNKGALPIRRIIAGPSLRQEVMFDDLRKLVDGKVEVFKSQTPYLG